MLKVPRGKLRHHPINIAKGGEGAYLHKKGIKSAVFHLLLALIVVWGLVKVIFKGAK